MRRQIAARLTQSLIVVLIVTTISFFIIRLAPGDPFGYSSPRITPAIRQHWREQFGYDRPLPSNTFATSRAWPTDNWATRSRRTAPCSMP